VPQFPIGKSNVPIRHSESKSTKKHHLFHYSTTTGRYLKYYTHNVFTLSVFTSLGLPPSWGSPRWRWAIYIYSFTFVHTFVSLYHLSIVLTPLQFLRVPMRPCSFISLVVCSHRVCICMPSWVLRTHPGPFKCTNKPLRFIRTAQGALYEQTNPQGSFTSLATLRHVTAHGRQTPAAATVCAGEHVMGDVGGRGQWQGGQGRACGVGREG